MHMGEIYCRRCIYNVNRWLRVITATWIILLGLFIVLGIRVNAQTAEMAVAAKAADVMVNKDITWLAMFVAGLNVVLTIVLVRAMVLMFNKFLESSVAKATAIQQMADRMDAMTNELNKRPCVIDNNPQAGHRPLKLHGNG